jgi:NAD(P)-dependent dehydrogenase (short-subunit alcohol dehydrogenase family)
MDFRGKAVLITGGASGMGAATAREFAAAGLILLDNYYAPAELTERIREWVDYYNHQRYHEAIDNVTPADKYYGRDRVILKKRGKVRTETLKMRRELNRMARLEPLPNGVSLIIMRNGIRSLRNQHTSPKSPDDKQS